MNKTITIIGTGNMGRAIAQGILKAQIVTPSRLALSSPHADRLTEFKDVQLCTDNKKAVEIAEIIILAVKPQIAQTVLEEIRETIERQLIISVMAGIKIQAIESILQKKLPIIRSMPNLAAAVGKSMTCWTANSQVSKKNMNEAKSIFQSFGKELMLQKEDDLTIATAVAGSGPAYIFYLAELMMQASLEMRLPESTAETIVTQTLLGASEIAEKSSESFAELRKKVTSKGGTTEAAFNVLYKKNTARIIIDAICAAQLRARELSENYD